MTGQEAATIGCLGAVFLALAALGRKPPAPGRGRALLLVLTVLGLGLSQLWPFAAAYLTPEAPSGLALLAAALLPFWLLAFGAHTRWLRLLAMACGMGLILLLPLAHTAAAADGAAPASGGDWWSLLLTQDPAAVTGNLAPLAGLVLLERMLTKVLAAVQGGFAVTLCFEHELGAETLKTLLHALQDARDDDPPTDEVPPDGVERRRRPRARTRVL